MADPLLLLSGLRKTVPGGRLLFEGVSLGLARGDLVAIMGESGVGKSTLLNLVAGLDAPDAGSVVLDGIDLATLDEDRGAEVRRRHVGFVFQAFHILPHLTLGRNVALPLVLFAALAGVFLLRLGSGDPAKIPSAWMGAPTIIRASFPAASCNASPSPARLPIVPR